MPPEEAAEWRKIVDSLTPQWFPGASFVLLEIYVAAVAGMRTWRAVMLAKVEGSPRHKEASRLYRREAAMVVKLGKLLRLGPRHDRTKLRTVPSIKPWDVTDSAPEKRLKVMP